ITSLLLREWLSAGSIDFSRFWSRRGRRLLPAAWVTIVIVIAMGAVGIWDSEQLRDLRSDVPYSLASVLNWHFIAADRSYGAQFEAPSPLQHFWSLAVEQQFYVILPLIVMGVLLLTRRVPQRKRLSSLVAVLLTLTFISAVANGMLAQGAIDRSYFGTETRAAEILIGALLACFTLRRTRLTSVKLQRLMLLLGALALAVVGWLFHVARLRSEWLYPWGLLLTAVCTSLIIFAGLQKSVLSRSLSVAPLLWLGRMSYGVYLLHWPVFCWLTPVRTGLAQWPLFGLRFVVTLLCATAMFRLIENPVRLGGKFNGRSGMIAASALLVIILGSTFLVTRNIEQPSALLRAAAVSPTSPTTLPAPPPIRSMIIGDNFARSIADGPRQSEELQSSVHIASDCGLALGGWVALSDGRVERDVERCASVRQGWVTSLRTELPEVTLVVGTTRDISPRRLLTTSPWQQADSVEVTDFLRTDIADLVDQLAAAGSKVAILTVPHMRNTAPPSALPEPPSDPDPNRDAMRIAERLAVIDGAPTQGFVENENARVDSYNAILAEVASSRGLLLLDLATEMASWPEGEFSDLRSPDGVGLSLTGAAKTRDWISGELRAAAKLPAEAAASAVQMSSMAALSSQAPLPEAPPLQDRQQILPGVATRVMILGDSVAHTQAFGLEKWSKSTSLIRVFNAAQFGCPVTRGGGFRFQQDIDSFREDCDWSQQIPNWLNAFQPDVVLLSSGIWEVVDRRFLGDDRFRHIGDPVVDQYILSEFLSIIDLAASTGATVELLTQSHFNAGLDQGYTNLPESDPTRTDRLNQILVEAVSLRPGVAFLLDFASWQAAQPGGAVNPDVRPDGLHFTDDYSGVIADWLGPELLRVARQE
ncbi:MAG: acyltransferase family protein, partial [Microthrixaceae bacterium]